MLAGYLQGYIHRSVKVLTGLLLVVMLLQPGAIFAQGDGTPPVEDVPPPPAADVPPPPVEEPPAPPVEEPPAPPVEEPPAPPVEEPPAPPAEEVVPPPPAETPALAAAPAVVQDPATAAPPTETPAPTAIPAPSVTCVQEGAVAPVTAGQVVEYRCDYTQGPLKPVIFALSSDWQYSITSATPPAELTWQDRLDVEFPTFAEDFGTVRIFLRATDSAVPGLETVKISFRAADYSAAALATEVHLQVNLLAPTPTPEPAIAFAPSVECGASGVVGSGGGAWSVRECTAQWKTENMVSVDLTASASDTAWRVVAVIPSDAGNAATLDANDGALTLTDADPSDSGFYSARFAVGTKVTACSTADTANVSLSFNSVSHQPVPKDAAGNPLSDIASSPTVAETANESMTGNRATPGSFSVNLVSASFSPIDMTSGTSTSTAQFVISYTAPAGCEWQMSLEIGDLVNGSDSIAASNLMFTSVSGIDATLGPSGPGTVIITPGASAAGTSGQIVVTGTLQVVGLDAFGEYRTTATASGMLLP